MVQTPKRMLNTFMYFVFMVKKRCKALLTVLSKKPIPNENVVKFYSSRKKCLLYKTVHLSKQVNGDKN